MADQQNLLPNGIIPPQITNQLNGIHSSQHSSRDSSPSATRFAQIPSSQLPPSTSTTNNQQFVNNKTPINNLTQKIGQLNVQTSTPIQNLTQTNSFQETFSPISSKVAVVPTLQSNNKQIQQSVFDNVPLNNIKNDSDLQLNGHNSNFNGRNQHLLPNGQRTGFSQNLLGNNSQPNVPSSSFAGGLHTSQNLLGNNYFANKTQQLNAGGIQPTNATLGNNSYLNKGPQPPLQQNVPSSINPQINNTNFGPRNVPPPVFQQNVPNFPPQYAPRGNFPNQIQQPFSGMQPPIQPQMMQNQIYSGNNNNNFQQQQQIKATLHNNRYPTTNYQVPPSYQQQQQPQQLQQNVAHAGFDKYWGRENYDLLQTPNILPPTKLDAPRVSLGQEQLDGANCSPEIFRCTMTKIPETNALLQKSRLPLGVLIHPFKDLNHLPVIQCNVIVRCRACRTYINPFVYFLDSKRWKCNLCYRINELPEEFQYDPVSKTYGDPSRRPEIKTSTIEYIAPAEYMLRPPQPAVYLFLLDISRLAIESGYLYALTGVLKQELDNLPGDARTQIGFIAYDSALHFFSLADGVSQPHEMIIMDIDEVFLPQPDNLLVNLKDRKDLVVDLLNELPRKYATTYDNNSALGAALQAAYKMMCATGGRVSVFQCALPNIGAGALQSRENPSLRAATTEIQHLNPANDFYKRLALECSGQQIAVDLFILNAQYVDIATISGITRFSGGCLHHFPLFNIKRKLQYDHFERCVRRYLTRKIGFEAVMRIRCTRGLSIHTFHGNFFVRSTDLLSLPNINPDSGFGMQVAIEENLSDVQQVCFQAALLYTSSKGERRIRVHTLCLPIASTLHDVIHAADQQCIVGVLCKMAVDRSMQSSLTDAREAFINVAIDILSSYKLCLNLGNQQNTLLAPQCLKLLPLLICALLKHVAFRVGVSTRLDDRVKSMIDMKTKPLCQLVQLIYPDLYAVHDLATQQMVINPETEDTIPMPPRLQLTARVLDSKGAFLMDLGDEMILLICPNVGNEFLNDCLGVDNYNSISDQMYELPVLNNVANQRLHQFVNYLNEEKPYVATMHIMRDNSVNRQMFYEHLIEDRMENALSYHEFLQHLKTQVK